MKRLLCGLLVATLSVAGAGYGQQAGVTLTNERPVGSFAIDAATLKSAPPMVALRVTKVVNPGGTPLQVFASLTYRTSAGGTERIPLGNVGLYPADRPAAFELRASSAFTKLKAASGASDVRLVVEIRRLLVDKAWTAVEVTVAPPDWRTEAKN